MLHHPRREVDRLGQSKTAPDHQQHHPAVSSGREPGPVGARSESQVQA